MAISTAAVTVASTATSVAAVDAGRRRLIIYNPGATVVYVGGSDVNASTGIPLRQYEKFEAAQLGSADTSAKQAYYAITGSGTQSVNVMTVGN